MDDRAAWDREMVRTFLAVNDAPCPFCKYNLRGTPGDKCPECAAPLALAIRGEEPRSRWDLVAGIAIVLTTVYLVLRGGASLASALSPAFSGMPSAWRMTNAIGASVNLVVAAVCAAWCIAVWRMRRRRPRPAWARPTSAAAGMLLGIFVVFTVFYGLRFLF